MEIKESSSDAMQGVPFKIEPPKYLTVKEYRLSKRLRK